MVDLLWIDVELPKAKTDEERASIARAYWSGDRVYPQGTTPDSREILTWQPATIIQVLVLKDQSDATVEDGRLPQRPPSEPVRMEDS